MIYSRCPRTETSWKPWLKSNLTKPLNFCSTQVGLQAPPPAAQKPRWDGDDGPHQHWRRDKAMSIQDFGTKRCPTQLPPFEEIRHVYILHRWDESLPLDGTPPFDACQLAVLASVPDRSIRPGCRTTKAVQGHTYTLESRDGLFFTSKTSSEPTVHRSQKPFQREEETSQLLSR